MGGLAEKLVEARKRRGLTLYAAAKAMDGAIVAGTLQALEGAAKNRSPAQGGEMKFKTAVALATLYYPEITLMDLLGSESLLEFKPVGKAAERQLKEATPAPALAS